MTFPNREPVRSGTITFFGVDNGDTVKVLGGVLVAVSRAVNGSSVIDMTGPGDAAVSVVALGNRYFQFNLSGFYAAGGTLSIATMNGRRGACTLKLDNGESWTGNIVVSEATKGPTNLRAPSRTVSVSLSGYISDFVEA